ncbi:hypothetical protein BAY61_22350 [Prauserella marina]|nr:hypothetical protein BAY61_22350 [Prauserella marina]
MLLEGDVAVAVTREERHQDILSGWNSGASVTAELAWCTIASGKYQGERAVEVRIGGHRVGELTYLMSRRYEPMIDRVLERGGRPGCAALIQAGDRKLEVLLRLPSHTTGTEPTVPTMIPVQREQTRYLPAVTASPPAEPPPPPAHEEQAPPPWRKPLWIAVAVVAVLVFGGLLSAGGDSEEPSSPVADSTTAEPATAVTTTSSTVAEPAPSTVEPVPDEPASEAAEPPPPPEAPEPVEPSAPAPPPPPPVEPPAPVSQCDPNYTGCVPIASDVDCAGGSGNGPAYVSGPVEVVGSDIYGLDSDGDGIACE